MTRKVIDVQELPVLVGMATTSLPATTVISIQFNALTAFWITIVTIPFTGL